MNRQSINSRGASGTGVSVKSAKSGKSNNINIGRGSGVPVNVLVGNNGTQANEEELSPQGSINRNGKLKAQIQSNFKSNDINPIRSTNRNEVLENKYLSDRSGQRPASSKID